MKRSILVVLSLVLIASTMSLTAGATTPLKPEDTSTITILRCKSQDTDAVIYLKMLLTLGSRNTVMGAPIYRAIINDPWAEGGHIQLACETSDSGHYAHVCANGRGHTVEFDADGDGAEWSHRNAFFSFEFDCERTRGR